MGEPSRRSQHRELGALVRVSPGSCPHPGEGLGLTLSPHQPPSKLHGTSGFPGHPRAGPQEGATSGIAGSGGATRGWWGRADTSDIGYRLPPNAMGSFT